MFQRLKRKWTTPKARSAQVLNEAAKGEIQTFQKKLRSLIKKIQIYLFQIDK